MEDEGGKQLVYSNVLHHVGVVVKDIDKAIAHLESLGIGPFRFNEDIKVRTTSFKGELHGEPAEWTTRVSNAQMGEVQLELLEPFEGAQALRESLDATGEGLHHIGLVTNDLEGDIAEATKRGAKIWTQSVVPRFVYFEPTEIGNLAIELRKP